MTKLLMCPPTHFRSSTGAQRQWERLVALLLDVGGASIELMQPNASVPDLVFTANAALICNRTAIIGHFRYAERQAEEERYREHLSGLWFATTFVRDAFFEGAGDALYDRRLPILYFGHGWRSECEAAAQIDGICGARVLPLRLLDPRFYHLDTCLCPLSSGHVMAFMPAFSPKSQTMLRMAVGPEHLIEVSEDDALASACNAVEAGDAIVLHRASRALRERLESLRYRVFETDLSAFQKAGGSAKCLTLKLNDGPVRRGANTRSA